jgi:hypothetical protein
VSESTAESGSYPRGLFGRVMGGGDGLRGELHGRVLDNSLELCDGLGLECECIKGLLLWEILCTAGHRYVFDTLFMFMLSKRDRCYDKEYMSFRHTKLHS